MRRAQERCPCAICAARSPALLGQKTWRCSFTSTDCRAAPRSFPALPRIGGFTTVFIIPASLPSARNLGNTDASSVRLLRCIYTITNSSTGHSHSSCPTHLALLVPPFVTTHTCASTLRSALFSTHTTRIYRIAACSAHLQDTSTRTVGCLPGLLLGVLPSREHRLESARCRRR